MQKLTTKQLKRMRNLICVVGILVGILIWSFLPDIFRNTRLFHVGNGEYGSKAGALILVLIQLFALIPDFGKEEIHTENAEERALLEEKRDRKELTRQIVTAIGLAITIWVVYFLAAFLVD